MKLFGVLVFLLSMAFMVESMNIMEHRPHLPKQKPPQTPKAKNPFPVETIKTVHVVFMNHLDVGYNGIAPEIGFARNVINRYFDVYYPRAINTSNWLRKMGRSERMIYTTHSWLLDLFFDCPAGMQINCPNQDQQDQLAAAILRGDITYHATPFNMQPEFMDESLFEFSFSLTKKLDKRFGKNTITMSQRDVPGFTRSALKVLKREGVRAVSVGVNCMTPPPGVPSAFVWRDPPSGQSVLALWHPNGYPNNPGPSTSDPGGISVEDCVLVDGLNSTIAFAFRTDNTGPPEVDEVISNFAVLQGEFPKARVMASSIDNFIYELETVRDQLPVLDEEIGDSWLMGVPSDPKKVAQFREISRARTECLRNAGGKSANEKAAGGADRAVQCSIDDPRIQNFSRIFVKLAEHTWGLPGVSDTGNWTNESFEKYRRVELQYVNCTLSWIEQRKYIDWAIEALEDHPLAADIQQRLVDIQPAYPSMEGMEPVNNLSTVFRCPNNVSLGFDGLHGNIIKYFDGKTDWASPDFPLGQFIYRSYSGADFDEFAAYYHYLGGPWWYKHNVTENANPISQPWYPTMLQLWKSASGCRFITRSVMQPEAYTYYGSPKEVWVEVTVDEKSGDVSVDLTWFGKTTTRLPEALFFGFTPKPQDNHEWLIEKFGAWISPNEVIVNGSQAQHGTFEGVKYLDTSSSPPSRRHGNVVIDDDESSQLWVKSFDSGVACPSPFTAFPVVQKIWSQPKGMAFNLYNNIWDTNYILWYPYLDGTEEASSFFRFLIKTT